MLTPYLIGVFCAENEELSNLIYNPITNKLDDKLAWPFNKAMICRGFYNSDFHAGLWWEYFLEID